MKIILYINFHKIQNIKSPSGSGDWKVVQYALGRRVCNFVIQDVHVLLMNNNTTLNLCEYCLIKYLKIDSK